MALLGFLVVFFPTAAFAGSCPGTWNSIDPDGNTVSIASYAGITSCFYAAASGSDSNTGADESHPWRNIPGMGNCSGNCAAHTPAANEGFVLKGGDTWSGSTFQINWVWGGSGSSHQIYIGVDQGWFTGGSWSRPIMDLTGTGSNFWVADSSKSWWWLDNIEITGMCNSGNGVYVQDANNIRASQLYFHGWSHCTSSDNVGFFSQGGDGSIADHNVIDGSDSSKNTFNGFFQYWAIAKTNYVSYVVSAFLGSATTITGNLFEHNQTSADGDHCNLLFMFGPEGTNTPDVSGNIVRNMDCPGGVNFWLNGNNEPGSSSWVTTAHNNIIWASSVSGNTFNIGGHPSQGNSGVYNVYNNTVIAENGGTCMGNGEASPRSTTNYGNNHCINTSNLCTSTGTTCVDQGGNVAQSLAAANGQGYTGSESQIFSPQPTCSSGTCITVQAGVNQTSKFTTTIAYPVYNSSNHTVTLSSPVSRPSSGAWDSGAYQLVGGTPTAVAPTLSRNGGSFNSSTSTTFSSSTPSPTFLYCVTTSAATCTPVTSGSSASITTNNSYVCAKTQASGYTDSSTVCSNVFWIGPISLVSGVNYPQSNPTISCSPTCTVTPANFAAGNLIFITAQASGLSGASYISSIAGCGTFTIPSALQKYDPTSQTAVSGAYVLSSGAITSPSCVVTMTANSPTTGIAVYQAATTGSGFTAETVPSSIITSSCTSCTGPSPTVTGTDIVFGFGAPLGSFLSANYPYANTSIDTATNTIIADQLNVSSASAMTAIQNNSHQTTMGAIAFLSTGTLAAPTFSPVGGTYATTQTVTISLPSGATGCYTTDGSTPGAATPGTCSAGTTYSGPLTVSSTQTVKALSTKSGSINSSVASATYTITTSTITGVTVSCSPTSINTAQTSTGTPTVTGTGGFSSAVTWTATHGTVSSGGVFTPSSSGTPYTAVVTATSVQDPSKFGSCNVSVSAGLPAAPAALKGVVN